MIMTEIELTDQQQKLLDIIRSAGGAWVKRSFIAEKIGKTSLNRWNVQSLDRLGELGLIEVEKRDVSTNPIGHEWRYRAID